MVPFVTDDKVVGIVRIPVQRVRGRDAVAQADSVVVEEPLEIQLELGPQEQRVRRSVSVTMRTPGHDRELAAGFLWTEDILSAPEQIDRILSCGHSACGLRDIVRVELREDVKVNLQRLERHSYTSSSCGVCGKKSIGALRVSRRPTLLAQQPLVDLEVIHRLPDTLRSAQSNFDRTGGLHGAGLFDVNGKLLTLYEDVGRHNAVDKLIGAQLLAGRLPLSDCILMLSGRACFELIQKAMMAGIAIVAAVGAPSSLAVELARDCGMTVLGFVRDDRFTIYAGEDRIRMVSGETSICRG